MIQMQQYWALLHWFGNRLFVIGALITEESAGKSQRSDERFVHYGRDLCHPYLLTNCPHEYGGLQEVRIAILSHMAAAGKVKPVLYIIFHFLYLVIRVLGRIV